MFESKLQGEELALHPIDEISNGNDSGALSSTNGKGTGQTPLLRRLFSPIKLNRLTIPNRILMSSMHLNFDDMPDQYERMAEFYALRARKEVGLIVTAGCGPNVEGMASANGFGLDCDDRIDKHRKITAAVHHEGGRIALQILHFGREAFHGRIVSSSPERLPSNMFTPRALSESEIAAAIVAFADCADRAVKADYDAIELIFSQGFLVHQFLAPACNKRTDRWGGSFDNRARLAMEIAAAVRARVGADYPLIFRIPCMDLLDGGLTPEESLALIEKLMPFGIDLLNVSIGWHESSTPTIAMTVPRAAFASAARYVRNRFPSLKIATSNRINDPRIGEQLLIDGYADVIAMGRPFLADPELVTKAKVNAFDEINTCIACNQSCLDYVFTGQPVGCSVNPDCGLPGEGQYPPLAHPLNVAVAGGGVAGMGAALFLARRGARVVLFEASDALGGQLKMAARIPEKGEFAETVCFYSGAVRRAGVEIRLGESFNETSLESVAWDHVVLAHGSVPRRLDRIPGLNLPHVVDYTDVLERGYPVAFPVVIIGGGGVACDVAKYLDKQHSLLRENGHRYLKAQTEAFDIDRYLDADTRVNEFAGLAITLLQRSSRKIGYRVGRTTRWILMQAIEKAGVAMRNQVDVLEVKPDAVIIYDRARKSNVELPARTVIVAAGQYRGCSEMNVGNCDKSVTDGLRMVKNG